MTTLPHLLTSALERLRDHHLKAHSHNLVYSAWRRKAKHDGRRLPKKHFECAQFLESLTATELRPLHNGIRARQEAIYLAQAFGYYGAAYAVAAIRIVTGTTADQETVERQARRAIQFLRLPSAARSEFLGTDGFTAPNRPWVPVALSLPSTVREARPESVWLVSAMNWRTSDPGGRYHFTEVS